MYEWWRCYYIICRHVTMTIIINYNYLGPLPAGVRPLIRSMPAGDSTQSVLRIDNYLALCVRILIHCLPFTILYARVWYIGGLCELRAVLSAIIRHNYIASGIGCRQSL